MKQGLSTAKSVATWCSWASGRLSVPNLWIHTKTFGALVPEHSEQTMLHLEQAGHGEVAGLPSLLGCLGANRKHNKEAGDTQMKDMRKE